MSNFVFRPRCELCGSEDKKILLSREFSHLSVAGFLESYYEGRININDLSGGKYELARCAGCGFIWQTYVLNDSLMGRLYTDWISSEKSLNKKKHAALSLYRWYGAEVMNISRLLNKKPYETDVLDFGMGWGYWCRMAKAFGYNVSGLELSKERTEFATKDGIEVIDFSGLSGKKYDYINAEQVFEHITEPLETVNSLARSLKKGGYIKIAVPDGRTVEKELANPDWRASKCAISPLEHINCFTVDTLLKMGKAANLAKTQPLFVSQERNLEATIRAVLNKYYRILRPRTSVYFVKIA